MDLAAYRTSHREQDRIGKLLTLVPTASASVMDAGARDGYIAELLANKGLAVTALDLEQPQVCHDKVNCVQGDITGLQFPNESFDLVLCAEVLEHVPPPVLATACKELQRVAKTHVLIGVPYEQDTRIGCTTCYTCGVTNPPWSHVNTFTEARLRALFPAMEVESVMLVGQHRDYTNALSALLLTRAGNPYGTYMQEESCANCGSRLKPPPERTLLQKVFTKVAVSLNKVQSRLMPMKPAWIHILFRKSPGKELACKQTTDNRKEAMRPLQFAARESAASSKQTYSKNSLSPSGSDQ